MQHEPDSSKEASIDLKNLGTLTRATTARAHSQVEFNNKNDILI